MMFAKSTILGNPSCIPVSLKAIHGSFVCFQNEYEQNLYPYGRMHNVAQSSTASNFWSFPRKVKE